MLNILPKVSSLPILLDINLVKMENIHFLNWPHVGHLIKGSCLGASYTKSAPGLVWCWYIFCRLRMYFICHMTPQNHSVEMSCKFMGESTLQHVTNLKSLVTIGILIVRGKMPHQKLGSYMCCHWRIELTGQPIAKKKMLQPQKYTFWEEVPKN